MTWGWTGVRGTWTGPEAEASMALMVERLGVTWTAITLAALQDTPQSSFADPDGNTWALQQLPPRD